MEIQTVITRDEFIVLVNALLDKKYPGCTLEYLMPKQNYGFTLRTAGQNLPLTFDMYDAVNYILSNREYRLSSPEAVHVRDGNLLQCEILVDVIKSILSMTSSKADDLIGHYRIQHPDEVKEDTDED